MKATELVAAVTLAYPKAVVDETFVKCYLSERNVTLQRAEDYVEDFREWMVSKNYWMEVVDEPDNVHRIKRSKLPALMEQYHCDTEEQLDDIFWYTYGVELVVEDDPVEA